MIVYLLTFLIPCCVSDELSSFTCLVSGQLHHPPTGLCCQPLQRGPCDPGEWIVLKDAILGTGICQPILSCGNDKMPVLSSENGTRCECKEGKRELFGKCENIFTQKGCSGEDILLPENFNLNSYQDDNCPPKFSCTPTEKCPSYTKSLMEIQNTSNQESKLEKLLLLESLVCNQAIRSICCPDFTTKSFLTTSVLLASLKSARGVSCSANPCPTGRWPWVGQDGLATCVLAAEGVKDCETEMEEFDGKLECLTVLDEKRISENLVGKNCGRRRRFAYGRCTRIF